MISYGEKFPRVMCIIVVYVVGNVMDLLKLRGVTCVVYGRPQELFVNMYFAASSKWKKCSNSCRGVPEQYVGRLVKVDNVV